MPTNLSNISQEYAGANQWHRTFPWFSVGHLLEAAANKNSPDFGHASQKAAIYFNDIQRFHWLLNQEDLDVAAILSRYHFEQEPAAHNGELAAIKYVTTPVEYIEPGLESPPDTAQQTVVEIAEQELQDISGIETGKATETTAEPDALVRENKENIAIEKATDDKYDEVATDPEPLRLVETEKDTPAIETEGKAEQTSVAQAFEDTPFVDADPVIVNQEESEADIPAPFIDIETGAEAQQGEIMVTMEDESELALEQETIKDEAIELENAGPSIEIDMEEIPAKMKNGANESAPIAAFANPLNLPAEEIQPATIKGTIESETFTHSIDVEIAENPVIIIGEEAGEPALVEAIPNREHSPETAVDKATIKDELTEIPTVENNIFEEEEVVNEGETIELKSEGHPSTLLLVADELDKVVGEMFEFGHIEQPVSFGSEAVDGEKEITAVAEGLVDINKHAETGFPNNAEPVENEVSRPASPALDDQVPVELYEEPVFSHSWQDDRYDPDATDGPEDSENIEPDLLALKDITEEKFESSSLSQSLAAVSKHFKEDAAEEDLVLTGEPYHTVDYFASQGIKLELEPRADDKFGQQLKSFTSWLKQMKRLPATKMANKEPDPIIENIASNSLIEGEVLTESMAEVLLKQGKTAQAVEVWQKLSLLHPEKSHYFATLIEKTKV